MNALTELKAQLDGLSERMPAPMPSAQSSTTPLQAPTSESGPLFSVAADAYIERIGSERGADHSEVGYLRHRTAIWIELMGDRADCDVARVRDYVKEGKAAVRAVEGYDDATQRWPGLSAATLLNTYASHIKTIVSEAAKDARIANPFSGLRLTVPPQVPRREVKALPSFDKLLGRVGKVAFPTRRTLIQGCRLEGGHGPGTDE